MTMGREINRHVLAWIEAVEQGKVEACKDQHLLVAYIRECFATEDIYTDADLLERYLRQEVYFPFKLVPWERFCIGLHLCTFWIESGQPRWPDLLLLVGRGAGKDAFISYESYCLLSPHSGLLAYDVDICANVEEQAMRPVKDVIGVLDNQQNRVKLKKYFRWTVESVTGLKYNGVLKGRTRSPGSKDGMRSGMVVFNEIHQYANYDNIKVFVTGLGKKKHPRRLYATTNGDVRDGPLDNLLDRAEQILKHRAPDNGLLPFVCRLDNKKLVHNPKYWPQANPTLPYAPDLMAVIKKEYAEWVANPAGNSDFMTKRMNLPQSDAAIMVTDYSNIQATANIILSDGTKQPRKVPDLSGHSCVAGFDYAMLTDWASANLRFWLDGLKYDINHSWLCLKSRDLPRIRADWRAWADAGQLTVVDDVEISPDLLANWIYEQGQQYDIKKLAMDNFRHALLASSLRGVGFDAKERKNLVCLRPSDIMRIAPVIVSDFENKRLVWGDQPALRWATNNTKLVKQAAKGGVDTGNFYFAKIEGKSRKTDPFMALVASATIENELEQSVCIYDDLPAAVW